MSVLRNYQQKCLDQIYEKWNSGIDRILVSMPTGSGKTVIMSELIRLNPGRSVLVTRGREIIRNASTRMGMSHDVVMAGHSYGDARISVCSIDTMRERGEYPDADMVICDEAHFAGGESYKNMAFMYPNARFASFTATPYIQESLRHIADCIIQPVTMKELIHEGHLVPPRYFAPKTPDLSKVRIQGGEYNQEDIEREVLRPGIIGSVCDSVSACDGSSLLFTSSVRHSREITDRLGECCRHIDASTSDADRVEIIRLHREGQIKVISNVGVLTTGVDLPWLRNIIDAAPTLSLCRNIQKIGRGTRPFPGKDHFDVFDHAGNVHTHGFITDDFTPTIDGDITRPKGKALVSTCRSCFGVFPATISVCPHCQAAAPTPIGRTMKVVDGRLVPITEEDRHTPLENAFILARKLEHVARKRGIHPAWVFFQVKRKYGERIANQVTSGTRR